MKKPKIQYKSKRVVDDNATGKLAKKYRESAGVQQKDVAMRLNMTPQNVYKMEQGGNHWNDDLLNAHLSAVDYLAKINKMKGMK